MSENKTKELDLDALEQEWRTGFGPGFTDRFLALIQRLREAEAAHEDADRQAQEILELLSERDHAIERIAQLEQLVNASKKRREEQSHWFGPDFFMADKPLVEQAFLNACRDEDAVLAALEI